LLDNFPGALALGLCSW